MLMLHCGAHEVTRERLDTIETPPRTATWTPAPHADVARAILTEAKGRGLEVTSERWGLMDGSYENEAGTRIKVPGARLYGAVDFGPIPNYETPKGTGMSMGIATSIDKSTAQRIMAGGRVFVCDNGMFVGEYQVRHIHGREFDLEGSVGEAFDKFFEANMDLTTMHDELRARDLTEGDTKSLIVDMAQAGAFASSKIVPVYEEWQKPAHDDFRPRTSWSLYNCATEIMKSQSPARQVEGFRSLNRVLVANLGIGSN